MILKNTSHSFYTKTTNESRSRELVEDRLNEQSVPVEMESHVEDAFVTESDWVFRDISEAEPTADFQDAKTMLQTDGLAGGPDVDEESTGVDVPTQYPGGTVASESPWKLVTETTVESPTDVPSNAPSILTVDFSDDFAAQSVGRQDSQPFSHTASQNDMLSAYTSPGPLTSAPDEAFISAPLKKSSRPKLVYYKQPALKVDMTKPWSTSA